MRQICYRYCTYPLSYRIKRLIIPHSAELEITVQLLVQIDKLVQLIESPVFTCTCYLWAIMPLVLMAERHRADLRLQLLEPDKYPHLYKCLYGLLMLLPQSSAFYSLRNRLNAVSSLGFLNVAPKASVIQSLILWSTTNKCPFKTVQQFPQSPLRARRWSAMKLNGKSFSTISAPYKPSTKSLGGWATAPRDPCWTGTRRNGRLRGGGRPTRAWGWEWGWGWGRGREAPPRRLSDLRTLGPRRHGR